MLGISSLDRVLSHLFNEGTTARNLEDDEYEQMSESDLTHIPSISQCTCKEIKCLNTSFGKQNTPYSPAKFDHAQM